MSKILYVEDNDDNVFMLKPRLQRRGFEVIIATDGKEGIELTRQERPDLIIMDLSLPILDGWTASEQLKGAPDTRDIPIIALSAHAMAGDREKALAAGCDDYDTKPVEFKRLVDKINALLERKSPNSDPEG